MENLVNCNWSWNWSGPRFVIESELDCTEHTLVDTANGTPADAGLIDINTENPAGIEHLNIMAHYYNCPEIVELFDLWHSWIYADPDTVSAGASALAENLLVSLMETIDFRSAHALRYPQYPHPFA